MELLAVVLCLVGVAVSQVPDAPPSSFIPGDICYCNDVYSPVCGSDGKTYNNECWLNCEAIKIVRNSIGDCKNSVVGHDYDGYETQTENGNYCAPWSLNRNIYPNPRGGDYVSGRNFPDGSVDSAENYCRNPDKDPKGPWCFTGRGDPNLHGYCNIPICNCNDLDILDLDYPGECQRNCQNVFKKKRCRRMKNNGRCRNDPDFMRQNCKKTCGFC